MLNRLAHEHGDAWNLRQFFPDGVGQLRLSGRRLPCAPITQQTRLARSRSVPPALQQSPACRSCSRPSGLLGKLQHDLMGFFSISMDSGSETLGSRQSRRRVPSSSTWDELPSHKWNRARLAKHDRSHSCRARDCDAGRSRLAPAHSAVYPTSEARFFRMVSTQDQ